MLYYRSNYYMDSFSYKRHDWIQVQYDELLTEREIERFIKMGYKLKYSDFTAVITSQKNVQFIHGSRFAIDENKVELMVVKR